MNVAIFKEKSKEALQWVGIPTNKFIDRHNQMILESAHLNFIKDVERGIEPYPVLLIWHIPDEPVGFTNWLAWDERGFLLAGGEIYKEYEDLIIKLCNSTPNMGMSHGMPSNKVILKQNKFYKYVSVEYSFLPQDEAANVLTKFKYK